MEGSSWTEKYKCKNKRKQKECKDVSAVNNKLNALKQDKLQWQQPVTRKKKEINNRTEILAIFFENVCM